MAAPAAPACGACAAPQRGLTKALGSRQLFRPQWMNCSGGPEWAGIHGPSHPFIAPCQRPGTERAGGSSLLVPAAAGATTTPPQRRATGTAACGPGAGRPALFQLWRQRHVAHQCAEPPHLHGLPGRRSAAAHLRRSAAARRPQSRCVFFWRRMKKAAVPTTTARGAAVSSSRITAVQSVYMAESLRALPSSQQCLPPR
jgi:hypothetical protein